jgi:hypothetical protein
MAVKRFSFQGTLIEIYDKVDELNKEGKNAIVYFGPYMIVEQGIFAEPKYEALIKQMKE